MEIIKKGTKKVSENKKQCSKCRCLFTYTKKDKNIDKDGVYVICPQCGSYIAI